MTLAVFLVCAIVLTTFLGMTFVIMASDVGWPAVALITAAVIVITAAAFGLAATGIAIAEAIS